VRETGEREGKGSSAGKRPGSGRHSHLKLLPLPSSPSPPNGAETGLSAAAPRQEMRPCRTSSGGRRPRGTWALANNKTSQISPPCSPLQCAVCSADLDCACCRTVVGLTGPQQAKATLTGQRRDDAVSTTSQRGSRRARQAPLPAGSRPLAPVCHVQPRNQNRRNWCVKLCLCAFQQRRGALGPHRQILPAAGPLRGRTGNAAVINPYAVVALHTPPKA